MSLGRTRQAPPESGDSARRLGILQVIQSLHFGGAERVVAELATRLDPARFDVRVACVREIGKVGEALLHDGIPVTTLSPATGPGRFLSPWHLWQQVRRFRPAVVHSHGLAAMIDCGPLAMLGLLRRWVHTFHYGNYPYANRRHMQMEAFLARQCRHLVAVANSQREAVLQHHRVRPQAVTVIPNGVRPNPHLADQDCRRRKRSEFGFGDSDFVAGTICVMSEQKGMPYLLEAARSVAHVAPNVKFLLVGGGPLEQELRRRSAALGLDGTVRFAGWRGDAPELMMALDAYVMPSLWEAMPLALLEAMAARRAIVVTDVNDNADFVAHGECGLLVPPRDPAALAAAILGVAGNPDLHVELSSRALARYESRYAISHMIASYERLYQAA